MAGGCHVKATTCELYKILPQQQPNHIPVDIFRVLGYVGLIWHLTSLKINQARDSV